MLGSGKRFLIKAAREGGEQSGDAIDAVEGGVPALALKVDEEAELPLCRCDIHYVEQFLPELIHSGRL